MINKVVTTRKFEREFKRLSKKYHSLDNDYENLVKELEKNPTMGEDLGNNTRKVRIAIASKNKGKRGGARVITFTLFVNVEHTKIYLLTIYDKSKQDTISSEEINHLKASSELKSV
jgi:hypothetical protein